MIKNLLLFYLVIIINDKKNIAYDRGYIYMCVYTCNKNNILEITCIYVCVCANKYAYTL
jgi:hypothetical protein